MAKPLHRALLPQVLDDLRALADIDDALVDAASRPSPTWQSGARPARPSAHGT